MSTPSIRQGGGALIGTSDVIRWDDTLDAYGHAVSIKKAVNLGIKHGLDIADKLKKDLQSDTGLLVTFPLAFLLDALQRLEGDGEALMRKIKA